MGRKNKNKKHECTKKDLFRLKRSGNYKNLKKMEKIFDKIENNDNSYFIIIKNDN